MNRKTKKVLNSILTLMLAVCVVMVIKSTMEDVTSQKDYDEANMLAGNQEVETEEQPCPQRPKHSRQKQSRRLPTLKSRYR